MSRTVAVVGFGVTGRSVARSLLAVGDAVVLMDDQPTDANMQAAAAMGLELQKTPEGAALAAALSRCNLVVPSPGVPVDHRVFQAAAAAELPVSSEVELAANRARVHGSPRLIAITGTNGKTTVTTMAAGILDASGIKAVAAGNIGLPLIDAVRLDVDVVVAEVSSFQLHFTRDFRPAVSCWLNFSADHLDWHPDLEHYRLAKARIWANQGEGDVAVFNGEDDTVVASAAGVPAGVERLSYATDRRADFAVRDGWLVGPEGSEIIRVEELPRSWPHDVSNALAAAAVAISAGATPQGCRDGLGGFQPLPHRVTLVGEADGVAWYDDSKATTPASVVAAVKGFESVVLIAGGRNKGLDLGVLQSTVPPVRAVVAIGEAAPEVVETFAGLVPVATAGDMEAAVSAAADLAQPGDAVLLSPGCASFDWYRSYADRGDDFSRIVQLGLGKRGETC